MKNTTMTGETKAGSPVLTIFDLVPTVPTTLELIEKLEGLLTRYVFFKGTGTGQLIAIWVLGTYIYDIFYYYGYLWLNSPRKRCGKSLLLEILAKICHNATP